MLRALEPAIRPTTLTSPAPTQMAGPMIAEAEQRPPDRCLFARSRSSNLRMAQGRMRRLGRFFFFLPIELGASCHRLTMRRVAEIVIRPHATMLPDVGCRM